MTDDENPEDSTCDLCRARTGTQFLSQLDACEGCERSAARIRRFVERLASGAADVSLAVQNEAFDALWEDVAPVDPAARVTRAREPGRDERIAGLVGEAKRGRDWSRVPIRPAHPGESFEDFKASLPRDSDDFGAGIL